jgi:folate-dependent phosphoribosylglycinamide formyltransferase PurN
VVSRTAATLARAWDSDRLVRDSLVAVMADRPCAAVDAMASRGVGTAVFAGLAADQFSDRLATVADRLGVDYLLLLYTRLLSGDVLARYRNRIVNVHPGLLPAFRGLGATDAALRSGARHLGTTWHFIDEAMDEGHVIAQAVVPINPVDPDGARRAQFDQMVVGTRQVLHWLAEDRVHVVGRTVVVDRARYDTASFVPSAELTAVHTSPCWCGVMPGHNGSDSTSAAAPSATGQARVT